MLVLRKLLKDEYIPLILLFAVIIALVIVSKISLVRPDTKVLGVKDINCQVGTCGFCKNCGNADSRLNCGQLSRCSENSGNFSCRFDIECF